MTHESNIALLIDADNCPAAKIEQILDELAKFGVINIRRAYGNWKSPNLRSWEEVLHDYAIQPIQQFAYTKGKNATDSAMIIDAMDLLYTQRLDAFCLASSDSDFTPLVMRIRANGLKVLGFGEKKTPEPFVNACSRFLYVENLGIPPKPVDMPALETPVAALTAASTGTSAPPAGVPAASQTPPASPVKLSAKELKGNTRLVNLLRNAVEAEADDEGWAGLGAVGSHISKQASFDSRNYGYAKLSDLIVAIGLFEVSKRDKGLYVRDKRPVKKAVQ
jgi:uncharacterized LabA/DUF88 family protein